MDLQEAFLLLPADGRGVGSGDGAYGLGILLVGPANGPRAGSHGVKAGFQGGVQLWVICLTYAI